jgi:N-acetylglucosaminyldiphosphoundecaprenol N-acetyl-beta-D-mannosaminyltransferase
MTDSAPRGDRSNAVRCCGVRIDCLPIDEASAAVVEWANSRTPGGVGPVLHLCNAWTLACGLDDPAHAARVDAGDLNLPDGMPLVWLARKFGIDMPDRVYGPDLMRQVLDRGRASGVRHVLYGTTPETLGRLTERLQAELPGLQIVGAEAPPFRRATDDELDELAARLDDLDAGILWVGLGTPQQDELVYRMRTRTSVVLVPVGAAFDFFAGQKAQAPQWMQRSGLEWLFRLLSEPRRLWRRYLVGNTKFVVGAVPDIRRALAGGDPDPLLAEP